MDIVLEIASEVPLTWVVVAAVVVDADFVGV